MVGDTCYLCRFFARCDGLPGKGFCTKKPCGTVPLADGPGMVYGLIPSTTPACDMARGLGGPYSDWDWDEVVAEMDRQESSETKGASNG